MYYTSTEFAEKIGVSANTLRSWDKDGILKPAKKTSDKGRRLYSEEQLRDYLTKSDYYTKADRLMHRDFRTLTYEEQQFIVDKYESDFNMIVQQHNSLMALLRSIMMNK